MVLDYESEIEILLNEQKKIVTHSYSFELL